MSELVIGTIVSTRYIAFARALGNSIRKHHPEIEFVALVADASTETEDSTEEPFRQIHLHDLEISNLEERLFLYDEKQFIVSTKPDFILHCLQQGYASMLYLDADMQLFDRIDDVLDKVRAHSLTLTPHIHNPDTDENSRSICSDHSHLLTGIYNGGFIGASNTPEAVQALQWWSERLSTHCIFDLAKGLHFDQRWLDLLPGYVGDLCIIHDRSINMAYWSLQEVDHRIDPGKEVACRLFHFSGFDPNDPSKLASYYAEDPITEDHPFAKLYRDYHTALLEAKVNETFSTPWPWRRFPNGKSIKSVHRRRYRKLKEAGYALDPRKDTRRYFRWHYGLWFHYKCHRFLTRLMTAPQRRRQRRQRRREKQAKRR